MCSPGLCRGPKTLTQLHKGDFDDERGSNLRASTIHPGWVNKVALDDLLVRLSGSTAVHLRFPSPSTPTPCLPRGLTPPLNRLRWANHFRQLNSFFNHHHPHRRRGELLPSPGTVCAAQPGSLSTPNTTWHRVLTQWMTPPGTPTGISRTCRRPTPACTQAASRARPRLSRYRLAAAVKRHIPVVASSPRPCSTWLQGVSFHATF